MIVGLQNPRCVLAPALVGLKQEFRTRDNGQWVYGIEGIKRWLFNRDDRLKHSSEPERAGSV
jgi:hypothetical protein